MAGSRLEIFPEYEHLPYRDDPLRFMKVLIELVH